MKLVFRVLGVAVVAAGVCGAGAGAATGAPAVFCANDPGPAGLGVLATGVACPEAAKVVNTWAARFTGPAVFPLDGTVWRCYRHPGTPEDPYTECVDVVHPDRKVDLRS